MQNNDFVTSFFSTDQVSVVVNSMNRFWVTVAGYLPSLISALILLIVGKFVAKLGEKLTRKALETIGFRKLSDVGKVNKTFAKVGLKTKTTDVVAGTIYWVIFLIFIMAAADVLNITVIVDTINSLIAYIPRVIAATIVFVITFAVGRLVRDVVNSALEQLQATYAGIVSGITEGLIIFFGVILAVSQLGLDVSVITTNLNIILGGLVATVVVSFGLGSKDVVTNLLAGYYVRKMLKKGQKVVLFGQKGTVKEIGDTTVVLETPNGTVFVPNSVVVKSGSGQ